MSVSTRILFCIFVSVGLFVFVGCSSAARRGEVNTPTKKTAPIETGSTTPKGNVAVTPTPVPPALAPVDPVPPVEPIAVEPVKPQESARIGIILGPGGVKTLAQIGVLREFEKAQVPVEAIVGLEWGAVIGGLYSIQGRANDVEWQMAKIQKDDFPQTRLLQPTIEPGSIDKILDDLKPAIGERAIKDLRVKFACPAHNLQSERTTWLQSGALRDLMGSCGSYPPLFGVRNNTLAAPADLPGAVENLRRMGANRIILVNVLPMGALTADLKAAGPTSTETLWREIRSQIRSNRAGIDFSIDVSTRGSGLSDIDASKALIGLGQKTAAAQLPGILSKLGL